MRSAATINLDAAFAETVNTSAGYHVFLTPNGDCTGLYVSQKSLSSFEVRELGGGASSIAFEYRIVAHRKGQEGIRMPDVTDRLQNQGTPWQMPPLFKSCHSLSQLDDGNRNSKAVRAQGAYSPAQRCIPALG
jgi:hypothetical protein